MMMEDEPVVQAFGSRQAEGKAMKKVFSIRGCSNII